MCSITCSGVNLLSIFPCIHFESLSNTLGSGLSQSYASGVPSITGLVTPFGRLMAEAMERMRALTIAAIKGPCVGGGVVLSGIAWVIVRIASHTTPSAGEGRLARQLGPISYPTGGLLVDDVTVLAQVVPGCDDRQLRKLLRSTTTGR